MGNIVKGIAILGSTGSIGQQTLDVVRMFPNEFRVVGLAGWTNLSLLQQQLDEFHPKLASCQDMAENLHALRLGNCSPASLEEVACHGDVDLVVMAISGSPCLLPTIRAMQAGKTVALASKEAMVMAGPIIAKMVADGAKLLPVDSEPSAIWQCLQGESKAISRIILTASGGAFRDRPVDDLPNVTPKEALKHPTWSMGKKITIDSATLMNKALEVIESHWMFGAPWEKIEVVLHPQSIVHSMVEFCDGSVKAQLGVPDMRLPIQYALFYPQRVANAALQRLDVAGLGALAFKPLDVTRYPCFSVAMEAARAGGTYLAALCAADDVAVNLFLEGRIQFTGIAGLVQRVLDRHVTGDGESLNDILEAEAWARRTALEAAAAPVPHSIKERR
ncbi:MAG: 1-deoxy-D-xylulose-5-phosphate reductoisomerase [Chloroflexi bacterium]|nr:1-deoxy-D-xylulose-5-phosphate reductoisomerase [Chloroflexota bacterium]